MNYTQHQTKDSEYVWYPFYANGGCIYMKQSSSLKRKGWLPLRYEWQ